jgi:anti-anti-sigma factor
MTLQTSIERIDANTAVITFVGSLTQGMNLKMTDDQMRGLADEDVSRLVVDLTSVPYIDSAGLGVLVHTRGLMHQRGGNLRLCGVADRVGALLKMTMMDAVLPVDADATASLAAFPSPAN